MNAGRKIQQLIAILISLAALAFVTVLGKNIVGLNAITVALLYLLVVLAVSALAELTSGIVAAVVSGLLVNFFFLPPFGTFYIAAPEDWVAFFAYVVTAIVVSYFAATVRRRALEADRLQVQLRRLAQLTAALGALQPRTVTLEVITQELRRAFELSYCAIYLFGAAGAGTPVSSGTRPSRLSSGGGMPPAVPATFLDVITEEGPEVRCLALKDQGKALGALVISQVLLSPDAAEAIAALVSLLVRPSNSIRSAA